MVLNNQGIDSQAYIKKGRTAIQVIPVPNAYTTFKDVPGGFPKSDLLGVTVALIHVAAQRFLAV